MAAMGHGRSYGQDSTVFGRKISGIFPCALWQDLQKRPELPSAALVTDVGNDLLYGVPPDRIVKWIAECLDRLADAGAATVVTQLPVASVERLSEARFRFYRRLLFPRSTLTLNAAKELAHNLNSELIELGEIAKNTGNSRVGIVVWLRSNSSQASGLEHRLAGDARRLAGRRRADRNRAAVAVDERVFNDVAAVGAFVVRHSAPRSATERPLIRWHDDLALLICAHARTNQTSAQSATNN